MLFNEKIDPLFDFLVGQSLDSYSTRATVQEKDKSYDFEIELAGFKKDEVDVFVEDGVLEIRAEQKNKKINKKRKRSILLPDDSNPEKISAKLEDGLLMIIVSKQKPQQKKIKIEV